MKARRKRPSPSLETRLETFYEAKTCVVTEGTTAVEWHHLDEDRSHTTFENLVPLSKGINGIIDTKRKVKEADLGRELSYQQLEFKAKELNDAGRYSRAYACNRVGSWVHRYDIDRALKFTAFALLNLRPLHAMELAEDVLKRDVIPLLQQEQSLTISTKAQLAHEIGLYYRGLWAPAPARTWLELAKRLAKKERSLPAPFRGRLMQSEGINRLITRDLRNETLDLFEEAKDLAGEGQDFLFSIGNHALYKAQWLRLKHEHNPDGLTKFGSLIKAQEVIDKFEDRYGNIPTMGRVSISHARNLSTVLSPWSRGEINLLRGHIALTEGATEKGHTIITETLAFFKEKRIAPINELVPGTVIRHLGREDGYGGIEALYAQTSWTSREFDRLAGEVQSLLVR